MPESLAELNQFWATHHDRLERLLLDGCNQNSYRAVTVTNAPAQGNPIRVMINYFPIVHGNVLAVIQCQQLGVLRFVVPLLAFNFSLLFGLCGTFRPALWWRLVSQILLHQLNQQLC